MSSQPKEIEVKFFLHNPAAFTARLQDLGAVLVQPRVCETNLRFDTPDRTLSLNYKTLRLRRDTQIRLTYKGPGTLQAGARSRTELEFSVSDFGAAQAFLEALGFQIYMMYEKWRTTYHLDGAEVTLDEMPYGIFAEIEGSDGALLRQIAGKLGLNWQTRINDSYTSLFDGLRQGLGLTFRDLSFENFAGRTVTADDLGVHAADD